MNKPGIPAPGFVSRIGPVVDRRRASQFQSLDAKSLLNQLKGGSMPFGWTVNPFRGCEIGCWYCYARPTHEYLGHVDPAEFEERIYVKTVDPDRLLHDLRRARDDGREIAIGTATDPYQPAERRFGITRAVLATMVRVPGLRVGITTKSALVTRDLPLLLDLARRSDLRVNVSLISLDADLLRVIEPRAPRPDLRLEAVQTLSNAGIRTRLFIMPVLPHVTDKEADLRRLLAAALHAGAEEAICQTLFLRTEAVRDHFLALVKREFPWAARPYAALYPRPGPAPARVSAAIERLVERLAREVGFAARSREARVRDEAPSRPRQISLVW